ncbi:MAG: MBL fold metallo-hydrolase [Actinomycetota bacterium]|nr:MBL fold metallo-hydrolase [Actinomycetota bacterium]
MTGTVQSTYAKGLTEVGPGAFAYLQPDGGWGWSNAGLLVTDDSSLLVDTLFDLRLTAEMLDAMGPLTTTAPIRTLVNTHANGDHCYGNELVADAEIIASAASAAEMDEVPPALMAGLLASDLGPELGGFLRRCFGSFEFAGITPTPPTVTFERGLDLAVGGEKVELIEVGPAHTAGDVIVHVPSSSVVFTGDILFVGGTPIVWAGPFANWLRACDVILDLGCEAIVPGHGPLADRDDVCTVKRYLEHVYNEASLRHAAGMSARDATFDIDLGEFADLGDAERLAVNVDAAYRELDPAHEGADVVELFRRMATLAGRS